MKYDQAELSMNYELKFVPAVLYEVQQGQFTANVHWGWMTKAICFPVDPENETHGR